MLMSVYFTWLLFSTTRGFTSLVSQVNQTSYTGIVNAPHPPADHAPPRADMEKSTEKYLSREPPTDYPELSVNKRSALYDDYGGYDYTECPEGFDGFDCCFVNCNGCLHENKSLCLSCKPGWYGYEKRVGWKETYNCLRRCHGNCAGGCDTTHGTCVNKTACEDGFYGQICEKRCSSYCRDGKCDRSTGKCECTYGYQGDSCRCPPAAVCSVCQDDGPCSQCVRGLWDEQCNKTCSISCRDQICSSRNGTCLHGCLDGYHGPTCTERCPNTCNSTASASVCDVQGRCSQGCVDGYHGDMCQFKCSGCLNTCKQHNGACVAGCHQGYTEIDGICSVTQTSEEVSFPWYFVLLGVIALLLTVFAVVFVIRRRNKLQAKKTSNDFSVNYLGERQTRDTEGNVYDTVVDCIGDGNQHNPVYGQDLPSPIDTTSNTRNSCNTGVYVDPDVERYEPLLRSACASSHGDDNDTAFCNGSDTADYYLSPVSGFKPKGKLDDDACDGQQYYLSPLCGQNSADTCDQYPIYNDIP